MNLLMSILILLNGPSASGKSSIQKEIQKQSSDFYLTAGIDTFFDALLPEPDLSEFEKTGKLEQYTAHGEFIRGIYLEKDSDSSPIVPLKIGPAGDQVIYGMHRAIAAYVAAGNNMIVDYILYKPEWLSDMKAAFQDIQVVYIGIKAPLSVIEEREKNRGTSPVGHARSHYSHVHEGFNYDLEVDVSQATPKLAAQKILIFLSQNNKN